MSTKRKELLKVLGDCFYHNKDVPETLDAILQALETPDEAMKDVGRKAMRWRLCLKRAAPDGDSVEQALEDHWTSMIRAARTP